MVDIPKKVQQAIWDDLTLVTAGNFNLALVAFEQRKALVNSLQGINSLEELKLKLAEFNLQDMQLALDDEETFFSKIDSDLERHKKQIDSLLESEEQNHVLPPHTQNHWDVLISSMSSIKRKLRMAHKSQRNAMDSLIGVSSRPKAKDKVVRNTVNEFIIAVNQQRSADADFTKGLGSVATSLDNEAQQLAAKSGIIKDPEVLRQLSSKRLGGTLGRIAASILIAASAFSFLMANPAVAQTADTIGTEQVSNLNLTPEQREQVKRMINGQFLDRYFDISYADDLSNEQLNDLVVHYSNLIREGETVPLNQRRRGVRLYAEKSIYYNYAKVILALKARGINIHVNTQNIASTLYGLSQSGYRYERQPDEGDSVEQMNYLTMVWCMLNDIAPSNDRQNRLGKMFFNAAFSLIRSDNPTFKLFACLAIYRFHLAAGTGPINFLKYYIKENSGTTDPIVFSYCITIAKKIVFTFNFCQIQEQMDLANFILSHSDFFEETELISARSQREKILRIENRERQKIRERQKADSTRQSNEQIGQSLNSW